jgi:glycosyltransferase involved in cell wall biosynthesis
MNLLVIGHPFLFAYNQKKYVAMKRLDRNLRLCLIVPSRMRERFEMTDCQLHPALSREEVVPLRARPARSHMTYLYPPRRMGEILRSFQPHVIHLDPGEPQALITVETIALQRRFAPGAAVTLWTVDNLLRRRRFPLGAVKRRLRDYSLRRVTAMLACNRRAAELLRAEGRYGGPVEVIPQYGLDVTEYQPGTESELREALGLSGSLVVGFVGRLVPEKGLRLLIAALGRLPSLPWKLLLVGAGPLEREIRRDWMARFPGRIVLVPAVPYESVPRYLRCSDIFVLPSNSTPHWMEQFGFTLAQALMLGIAAIGSSSGAIPEVLGPGGIVFEEGNTEALARALEELLNSRARREQLGALGREFALQNYTQEGVAGRYLAVFEKALSSSPQFQQRESEAVPSATQAERTPAAEIQAQ